MDRRELLCGMLAGSCLSLLPDVISAAETSSMIVGKFGHVPAPGVIKRIVSAGPPSDILLLSLAPEKLLGLSTHNLSSQVKKYFPIAVRDLPNTGRIAGRGSTFPLEKLLSLKPDLIVDVGTVDQTFLSSAERVSRQTGIPYIVVDGYLNRTDSMLRELGAFIGETERGKQLGNFAAKVLGDAAKTRRQVARRKPIKVYLGRGADGLETGLAGSIHTEILNMLGTRSVADDAGNKAVARVSMEQILTWNPEVIVTPDANFFQQLQRGGVWQHISAVKNKRYYLTPGLPLGWMGHPPSINRLMGLIWFRHILYPELLPVNQYSQQMITYFKLFYGYNLSQDELLKLSGVA